MFVVDIVVLDSVSSLLVSFLELLDGNLILREATSCLCYGTMSSKKIRRAFKHKIVRACVLKELIKQMIRRKNADEKDKGQLDNCCFIILFRR